MSDKYRSISETIRENRLKLGYTQDTLANELHVSAQAVSKWETGQSMPDINLLIPLSRLLKIGVDQLLGGDRREEFEQRFRKSIQLGDKISLVVCEDALKEFPDDTAFLFRRACSELFLAKNNTERDIYLNRAVFHFEQLHKSYPDDEGYMGMLAQAYFEQGDRDAAIELARKCNNKPLLASFLQGEELIRCRQEKVMKSTNELCRDLIDLGTREALETAHTIIDNMMMQDRALNANMICHLYMNEARLCLEIGDTNGFEQKLNAAYDVVREADAFGKETVAYTSPLFDHLLGNDNFREELYLFITEHILDFPAALSLKRRIVNDKLFLCRPLLKHEWRNFFRFCDRHINEGNFFNFGTGWDLTEEQVNQIGETLIKDPKYHGNACAELWEINRSHVEHLISNGIMTGYVAHFNNNIFAYCNCGEKGKHVAFPTKLLEMKTSPDDAKVLSIMEIMVANTYRDCGLKEQLLENTLEISKKRGFTHAEIYPLERLSRTIAEFENDVALYKKLGFEIIEEVPDDYSRWYIMQKKL